MKTRFRWFFLLVVLTSLIGGCAIPHAPLPTDPSNPLKRIAVLPMKNDTTDVDGPDVVRQKMVEALTNRSYVVMDTKESDQILRDRMGINLGGQLELTTPQKLGETLGVEGVLYGTLMDFDETTTGLYNAKKVRGMFKIVNTATGQTVWQRGLGVKKEQGTSGLASGLVKLGARAADARDKDAPWVLLQSTTTNQSTKDSLIMGLGTKLLSKAVGIHLEAESDRSIVRFRIDGVLLRGADPIDIAFHPRIVSRIKVISDLDISETRKAQDGSFQFTALGRTIDFRVSIIPSIHGEDVVIRILDKEHLRTEFSQMNLSRLGFGDGVVEGIRRLTRFPHGMFLVTGPTGSGKTTTLYTALQEMDHDVRKFITIEDPVEYHLPGIVQIPVNEMKGVTFASGLRNILRHDPDVVMVGEIRDRDTAEVAVQASLTGHLVFSTVHANSSTDVILRFLHMGIDPYNFVSAVNGVLTQRLLRTLCGRCRKEARYGPSVLAEMGIPSDTGDAGGGLFFEPVGCGECNGTGYKGRISTGEFVPFTEEIRDWMIQRRSFGEIRAGIRKSGIASLRGNAVALARAGRTSVAEINRVTSPEED